MFFSRENHLTHRQTTWDWEHTNPTRVDGKTWYQTPDEHFVYFVNADMRVSKCLGMHFLEITEEERQMFMGSRPLSPEFETSVDILTKNLKRREIARKVYEERCEVYRKISA